MIKFSGREIWSKIPLEIKNKPFLALFLAEHKNMYYSATRNIVCVLFIWVQKTGALL